MIVIADTSPINYLVLIDAVDILPRIFDCVLIPKAVSQSFSKLKHPKKYEHGAPACPLGWK